MHQNEIKVQRPTNEEIEARLNECECDGCPQCVKLASVALQNLNKAA